MRSYIVLLLVVVVSTLSDVEAAYKRMSTYKGYTLISWINPFNSYATQIKSYLNHIRTYYWNLWGLLHGKVVHHGVARYGDHFPQFEEIEDVEFPDIAEFDYHPDFEEQGDQ